MTKDDKIIMLHRALAELLNLTVDLALPVEDGDEEWPQITRARAVLDSTQTRGRNADH